ncbi:MAG: helix-turn-helix transcriptional regulator [Rhizobiales bacterium]|nr:helix-turn-helix transcriptional regulator [Hyphomicrobiales bacterium]
MRMIKTDGAKPSTDDTPVREEETAENCELDLLGDPIQDPTDERGRPSFEITDELRHTVAVLTGAGESREAIADAIGCSEKTLRTYFLPELKKGGHQKRAEVILSVYQKATTGQNVAAAKAYLANGFLAAAQPPVPTKSEGENPVEKLGKKEQALIDAKTVDAESSWGDLLHVATAVQ